MKLSSFKMTVLKRVGFAIVIIALMPPQVMATESDSSGSSSSECSVWEEFVAPGCKKK